MATINFNLGQTVRSEFQNTEVEGTNIKIVCTLMAIEEGEVTELRGAVIDKESGKAIGSVSYDNNSSRRGDGYNCTVSIYVKEYKQLQMESTELLFSSIEQIKNAQVPNLNEELV